MVKKIKQNAEKDKENIQDNKKTEGKIICSKCVAIRDERDKVKDGKQQLNLMD